MIKIETLDFVGLLGQHLRTYQAGRESAPGINVLKTHDVGTPLLLLPPNDYDALFLAVQELYIKPKTKEKKNGKKTKAPKTEAPKTEAQTKTQAG